MKKIKDTVLQVLSGFELLIRGFSNRQTVGVPVNTSWPTQPRIMKSCEPAQRLDFNQWAQHIHSEVVKSRY
jgi:hypothetical protein